VRVCESERYRGCQVGCVCCGNNNITHTSHRAFLMDSRARLIRVRRLDSSYSKRVPSCVCVSVCVWLVYLVCQVCVCVRSGYLCVRERGVSTHVCVQPIADTLAHNPEIISENFQFDSRRILMGFLGSTIGSTMLMPATDRKAYRRTSDLLNVFQKEPQDSMPPYSQLAVTGVLGVTRVCVCGCERKVWLCLCD